MKTINGCQIVGDSMVKFDKSLRLTGTVVPDGVTMIDDHVFSECLRLIPESAKFKVLQTQKYSYFTLIS